jgi:hypothetical protein
VQLADGGYSHVALNRPMTSDEEKQMVGVLNRLRAQLGAKDKPDTQQSVSSKS